MAPQSSTKPLVYEGNLTAETARKTRALLVMPEDHRLPLLKLLQDCGLEVLAARDCHEAHRMLRQAGSRFDVILTEPTLADGSWAGLLAGPARHCKAEVIVCMRFADPELWIDFLEGGAYDVLVEPYQRDEVQRIVESAAGKALASFRPGSERANAFSRIPLPRTA